MGTANSQQKGVEGIILFYFLIFFFLYWVRGSFYKTIFMWLIKKKLKNHKNKQTIVKKTQTSNVFQSKS